jgi:glycopeptide antibiotics resistance protein
MTLFISSFLTVFLLVFQQQNVVHRRFGWASTTSVAITVSQFVLIKAVAGSGLADVVFMASGGVLGVLSSMFFHPILMRRKQ